MTKPLNHCACVHYDETGKFVRLATEEEFARLSQEQCTSNPCADGKEGRANPVEEVGNNPVCG